MNFHEHWVSVWGNAVSVAENRPERYARDITIRYPIHIPFEGKAIRLTFDNYCGTESVTLTRTTVLHNGRFYPVRFGNARPVTIRAGGKAVSDPLKLELKAGDVIQVSFYLGGFTLMRSVVYASGPLSQGLYANGDETTNENIPSRTSRSTHLFYFLSNVTVLTDREKRAIVCYGDSITAQDWPSGVGMRDIIIPPSSAAPPPAPGFFGNMTV